MKLDFSAFGQPVFTIDFFSLCYFVSQSQWLLLLLLCTNMENKNEKIGIQEKKTEMSHRTTWVDSLRLIIYPEIISHTHPQFMT